MDGGPLSQRAKTTPFLKDLGPISGDGKAGKMPIFAKNRENGGAEPFLEMCISVNRSGSTHRRPTQEGAEICPPNPAEVPPGVWRKYSEIQY